MPHAAMTEAAGLVAHRAAPLSGRTEVPGDKSVSHRSLMFASLAIGRSTVSGLLEGEDVLATAAAMRAMGAEIERSPNGTWQIDGVGVGGLAEPDDVIDLGNSGTSARLLAGLLASHPMVSVVTGDASLRSRPMGRVFGPLGRMGARFAARQGDRLPAAILGTDALVPITFETPLASAQVKSCVLLAGLNTRGETTVIERKATRDHTERMLRHFGVEVGVAPARQGGEAITVAGYAELTATHVAVPGDISSAAFPIVAGLIVPGSDIVLERVGLNPRRAGLIETLIDMGADITLAERREIGGEPVADIRVRSSDLKGIRVPPERAPSMIDEYPALAMAAACAEGETHMAGLAELRVKESDRLAMTEAGLKACGVETGSGEDWLSVRGSGRPPRGGGRISTALDHRIAMSFLTLGLAAVEPVTIDDARPIATSFPGFADLFATLSAAGEPPIR